MKKVYVILVSFFLFITYVKADSVIMTLDGPEQIDLGNTFDVDLTLSGSNIWGFIGKLTYDNNKLELIEYSGYNNFDITVGTRIVADSDTAHNNLFKIATLKFKAKDNFKSGQSTTITINEANGVTDSELINASQVSLTIQMSGELEEMLGDVDNNGQISLNDIIALLKIYLNNGDYVSTGDMDSNGKIGLNDIIQLLRLYLIS